MIPVEGRIELGASGRQVFGFEMPQVPAAGDLVEHPAGVRWRVQSVRWEVGDVTTAVLTVEPE